MEKDQEIDTSSRQHNISHVFKKDAKKNGAGTERTWYLIWKAADRCLLKVGLVGLGRALSGTQNVAVQVVRHFVASRFKTHQFRFKSNLEEKSNQLKALQVIEQTSSTSISAVL